MKWRIAINPYNLNHAPWSGAIGIEEDDSTVGVPSLVCWFTRGWNEEDHPAYKVVKLHNQQET